MNACAHVQHHYFLSSTAKKFKTVNPSWYINDIDPILECLKSYDEILGEFKTFNNIDFIILTGLSQTAIDEPIFYYNLKKPEIIIVDNFSNDETLNIVKSFIADPMLQNENKGKTKYTNIKIYQSCFS